MNKLTYQQAYDKIIQAYFRDEIKPFKPKFCFCGTLCGGDSGWYENPDNFDLENRPAKQSPSSGYSGFDLGKMEAALFAGMEKVCGVEVMQIHEGLSEWEDALFAGMCAALEVLKQIHKERGEDVDGVPEFTKRKLEKISD